MQVIIPVRTNRRVSYIWSNPDKPIHYSVLENVYKAYREHYDNWRKEDKQKKYENNLQSKINDAIELLKANGFIIFKSV